MISANSQKGLQPIQNSVKRFSGNVIKPSTSFGEVKYHDRKPIYTAFSREQVLSKEELISEVTLLEERLKESEDRIQNLQKINDSLALALTLDGNSTNEQEKYLKKSEQIRIQFKKQEIEMNDQISHLKNQIELQRVQSNEKLMEMEKDKLTIERQMQIESSQTSKQIEELRNENLLLSGIIKSYISMREENEQAASIMQGKKVKEIEENLLNRFLQDTKMAAQQIRESEIQQATDKSHFEKEIIHLEGKINLLVVENSQFRSENEAIQKILEEARFALQVEKEEHSEREDYLKRQLVDLQSTNAQLLQNELTFIDISHTQREQNRGQLNRSRINDRNSERRDDETEKLRFEVKLKQIQIEEKDICLIENKKESLRQVTESKRIISELQGTIQRIKDEYASKTQFVIKELLAKEQKLKKLQQNQKGGLTLTPSKANLLSLSPIRSALQSAFPSSLINNSPSMSVSRHESSPQPNKNRNEQNSESLTLAPSFPYRNTAEFFPSLIEQQKQQQNIEGMPQNNQSNHSQAIQFSFSSLQNLRNTSANQLFQTKENLLLFSEQQRMQDIPKKQQYRPQSVDSCETFQSRDQGSFHQKNEGIRSNGYFPNNTLTTTSVNPNSIGSTISTVNSEIAAEEVHVKLIQAIPIQTPYLSESTIQNRSSLKGSPDSARLAGNHFALQQQRINGGSKMVDVGTIVMTNRKGSTPSIMSPKSSMIPHSTFNLSATTSNQSPLADITRSRNSCSKITTTATAATTPKGSQHLQGSTKPQTTNYVYSNLSTSKLGTGSNNENSLLNESVSKLSRGLNNNDKANGKSLQTKSKTHFQNEIQPTHSENGNPSQKQIHNQSGEEINQQKQYSTGLPIKSSSTKHFTNGISSCTNSRSNNNSNIEIGSTLQNYSLNSKPLLANLKHSRGGSSMNLISLSNNQKEQSSLSQSSFHQQNRIDGSQDKIPDSSTTMSTARQQKQHNQTFRNTLGGNVPSSTFSSNVSKNVNQLLKTITSSSTS